MVARIPCKPKCLSSVALLKLGVRPVHAERAGDQPPAGTGGRGVRRLWGSGERVPSRQVEGSWAPAPRGRRAGERAGSQARGEGGRGRGCTNLQRVGGANAAFPALAPPTGFSANHMQKASLRGVGSQSDPPRHPPGVPHPPDAQPGCRRGVRVEGQGPGGLSREGAGGLGNGGT